MKNYFSVLSNSVFLPGKNMWKPLIKAVAKCRLHYCFNILKHFSLHYFCLHLQGGVHSSILQFVGEKEKLTQRIQYNTPGTIKCSLDIKISQKLNQFSLHCAFHVHLQIQRDLFEKKLNIYFCSFIVVFVWFSFF